MGKKNKKNIKKSTDEDDGELQEMKASEALAFDGDQDQTEVE